MAMKTAFLAAGLWLGSAHAITVEGMLAAPRRSTGSLSPKGDRALFSETKFNWTTEKASTAWYFLDTESGNVTKAPFGSDASEVVWVGDTEDSILYVNASNAEIPGGVTLYTADLSGDSFEPKLVASLHAPLSGIKAVKTDSGINFVGNCLAYESNGTAYNPELVSAPKSSGRLYDANMVRHWNYYITAERVAVFSGVLNGGNGSYSYAGELKNLLWGMNYTITRPESPVQGSSSDPGDYDLAPDGSMVAFRTKSPDLPKANYTASYIYVVPFDGSAVAVPINGPETTAPQTAQGASGAPVWSHDSSKVAYTQQDGIDYESDKYKLYVADMDGMNSQVRSVAEDWDSSPTGLKWSSDDANLWVTSELHASVRLWAVPQDAAADFKPTNITGPETVLSDFDILKDGSAFVSAAASWTSRMFYKQKPGAEKKKYPLAFIIHGGPQSTQGDNWSVRWNLRLWADQGFVVTATQFTGSPSYSQAFTDKIQANWGGTPYTDLVKVFEHLRDNVDYIDTDRAIAAGASFGCYMTNWIQGHDLGREFKALVCHDGKINQVGSYATDELWFIQRDNNGTVWNERANYELWDPLAHFANASTPQFVIHNDLDYRVVQAEGFQTFNILQSLGVPSRFLHFPDEGHWVTKRQNSLLWHNSIFNWIRYWVGLDDELMMDGVITQ
ncbi:dipeptidyl-peptidase V precursor [Pyrenophora tritici-repentis Pt-1C-BFP]|uniref:Dipeptidyl-peptidase V n=1 Tax=Pyrenophora tritici-repentis (strain Pt-1C-BFP) TaxID=426418 RepID=B2WKU7_PYRTR|nr:dipeptidyl-peptidase V precursor [Pyrenophora tritici-repentis Pt-1C-BFP]EDU43657.1 dipeptidyl-peptidase V precursor [Pyrenophora tritici-repentis Pt-1C-BFP]